MLKVLIKSAEEDYELIDSGEGEKLERFGEYVLRRPDPQALWPKNLDKDVWDKAQATFSRDRDNAKWKLRAGTPKDWTINYSGLTFLIKPTAFKHTGLFPEQASNWSWLREKISQADRPIKVLNLFAYTGGASLMSAASGAEVVHVDSSKSAINWAKENQKLSNLDNRQIRFIEDDVRKFVEREIKRGNHYDVIIMDPPAFGRGAKNEIWKIEEDFLPLIDKCFSLLSERPLAFLVNGYSAGYSALAYENSLLPLLMRYGGVLEKGELALEEANSIIGLEQKRLLPTGIFARWSK